MYGRMARAMFESMSITDKIIIIILILIVVTKKFKLLLNSKNKKQNKTKWNKTFLSLIFFKKNDLFYFPHL